MKRRFERSGRLMGLAVAVAATASATLLSAQSPPVSRPAGPAAPPSPGAGASDASARLAAAALPTTGPGAIAAPPGTAPATGPRSPGGSAASGPTSLPTTRISMYFKEASVDAVLEHLSEAAGFQILKEVPVPGRVNLLVHQSVTPEEAVVLLNSVLKTQGFTAIQQGKMLRIVERSKALHQNIPVRMGNDPDKIDPTDELITWVIPIKSVDAVKLRQDLTPLLGTDAEVTANQGSNSILITDTAANIRRVVQITHLLDQSTASSQDLKIFQLKYADATSAAKLLTTIFKPADQTSNRNAGANAGFPGGFGPGGFGAGGFGGGQGGQGGGGRGGRGGNGGGASAFDQAVRTGQLNAAADDRTNSLIVSGPSDTLKVVEQLVKQLDSNPIQDQTFFIYNLKNGQAATMESVLNTMFGGSTSGTNRNNTSSSQRGTTSAFGGTSSSRLSSSGSSGFGGSSGGFGSSSGSGGFGSSNSRSGGTGLGSTRGNSGTSGSGFSGGGTRLSSGSATAASQLAGQVFVVANTDTNSLLVTTSTKYKDQVAQIIAELDRPVAQVLIKVLVAEVTHENTADFGVDFSILNTRANGNGQSGGFNLGNAGAGTANGGLVVQVLETNVNATLHALATQGKLDVLSRPYILASDNQLASITVGQEVPFITNSRITDTGQTINNISYQDIGIILDVQPHINPDGLVIMDVAPEISQLTGTQVPIGNNVSAPVIAKRSAQSRVGIKNGNTIVIGGLMEDRKTLTVSKVPILGDLPLVGPLFSRIQTDKTKTELLIFLTPHVALQPDLLRGMSREELGGTKLTPNAVAPGTFQDHMEGLRRGGTPDSPTPSTGPVIPGGMQTPTTGPTFYPWSLPRSIPSTDTPAEPAGPFPPAPDGYDREP